MTTIALAIPAATATAAVTTPTPGMTVADVQPAAGSTVGVGHPVIVTYTAPVSDRAAAERSIRIVSPARAAGHYEWLDDRTVQFVPKQYWPAHSEVKLFAGGMPLSFDVGASVVRKINVNIRRIHALGIQKSLEQQPVTNRIHVRDFQQVRNN